MLLLAVIAFIWMIPLIYMLSVSFRTPDNLFAPSLLTQDVTLRNYQTIFTNHPELLKNFLSSFIISAATTAAVTLFSAMAAFGFSRRNVPGKRVLHSLLLVTLCIPVSTLVIPITQLNARLGWINEYQGLFLPYIALGVPFSMVLLRSFINAIPLEVEEAAHIDGCGSVRFFIHIALPILKPGLSVVAIWQFLISWNEYFLALVTINRADRLTLPLVAMRYQGLFFSDPGALFAILAIVNIPPIIIYCIVQRRFVSGMLSGSVTG